MISNRGSIIWPELNDSTLLSDHWRLRIQGKENVPEISHQDILDVLSKLNNSDLSFIKVENLYSFDGVMSFS